MCGEREAMRGRDICGTCGSSAKNLGPEAEWLLSDEPREPDYDEELREAQESGDVFEESHRGDRL